MAPLGAATTARTLAGRAPTEATRRPPNLTPPPAKLATLTSETKLFRNNYLRAIVYTI